jgi:hypothetical protein
MRQIKMRSPTRPETVPAPARLDTHKVAVESNPLRNLPYLINNAGGRMTAAEANQLSAAVLLNPSLRADGDFGHSPMPFS